MWLTLQLQHSDLPPCPLFLFLLPLARSFSGNEFFSSRSLGKKFSSTKFRAALEIYHSQIEEVFFELWFGVFMKIIPVQYQFLNGSIFTRWESSMKLLIMNENHLSKLNNSFVILWPYYRPKPGLILPDLFVMNN